ncbi:hypothetical protein JCM8547_004335 [Rhodosporidiobolus lusitaniae]
MDCSSSRPRLKRFPSDAPLLGDSSFTQLKTRRNTRRTTTALLSFLLLSALLALPALRQASVPFFLDPLVEEKKAEAGAKSEKVVGEWSQEDQRLREYRWITPPVHASLKAFVDFLPPAQRKTREWLARTRAVSLAGTGIGLGADDPPRKIQPGEAGRKHREDPVEGEGPGLFFGGSRRKYLDLVQEWKTGRPVEACEKGRWEDEYKRMHDEMMSGEREPWLLEFVCHKDGVCGGIADRMLGMVSTFLYAILSGRAFSLRWEQPAPVDLIFDSPYIDWSRSFTPSSPNLLPYTNKTVIASHDSLQQHDWPDFLLDNFFPSFPSAYGAGKEPYWVSLDINRGVVFRSFYYDAVKPRLEELGLQMSTAYSCLTSFLLRPKPAILKFITQYTSFFSLPENYVVGLQIRTGDSSMLNGGFDTSNVTDYDNYFTCASQLARRYAHPSQRIIYFLLTDSKALQADALRAYPDRVIVTGLEASHDELGNLGQRGFDVVKRALDGYARTVAESYIFAGTDAQILTFRSGFGKIPTWLRGKDETTVQLFNPHLDPEMTESIKAAYGGTLPPSPDCSTPNAIKPMSHLALDWSLG